MIAPYRLLLSLWLLLCGAPAIAAAPPPAATPATPAVTAPAPMPATAKLVVANRTIFVFRAALSGYTPEERSEGARRRLDRALARSGAHLPGLHPIPEGTQVTLDGALLFLITPADINPLAGDTTEGMAAESAALLVKALEEKREQASPRYLAIAIGLCAGATLLYGMILRGLYLLHGWVGRRSTLLISRRLGRVTFKNVRVLDAEHYVTY